MSIDLGSVFQPTKPAAPNKPSGPSPALLAKMAEALAAADEEREARSKADALKKELFAQMKGEGIDTIDAPGRDGPVRIERGEECKPPSMTVLKANLPLDLAEKVWAATKKPYERLATLPKPGDASPSV